jgi:hypothetical protein
MKLESRLGDFLRSLFKVTGIPQATTDGNHIEYNFRNLQGGRP